MGKDRVSHSRVVTKRLSELQAGSNGAQCQPEQFEIEAEDGGGYGPSQDGREARVGERAHLCAAARELDQRDHRKRKLKAQNHLAENQQRSDFAFAIQADDNDRRYDGREARNQPAQPRFEPQIQETFHDNLPGERAGKRGILPRSEQRASEQRTR